MAIWDFLLKLDGVDVANYGFLVSDIRGWWDSPPIAIPEAQIPGQDGATETDDEEIIEPLDLVAIGELKGANEQGFEDKRDALNLALYGRQIQIIAGSQPDRYRVGRVRGVSPAVMEGFELDQATTQIKIHCPNPLLYNSTATTVTGASGADLACAQGTAWTWPVVTVTGASSPLVLTGKDYAGATIGTLTVDAAGTVVVDMGRRTITDDGVPAGSALTAGDFFRLISNAVDYAASHWPTIRASSGSGVSITYRKAYL